MQANGWWLFAHPLFEEQLERLTTQVETLAGKRPKDFQSHPAAKLLATLQRYILVAIPHDPNAPEFRQGNSLGPDNRHWFRAKFHRRYRLFFRFSKQRKIIIYTWVNDESSLRKAGAKTDPYVVFRGMLERGQPPSVFDELLKRSRPLPRSEGK